MFYIDLTLQFLIKLIGQFIAPAIALVIFLMLITAITKNGTWLKDLLNRVMK